jgi:hypothetical protein
MNRNKQIKSNNWLTEGYSGEELKKMKAEAIKEAEIEEMAKDLGIAFQLAGTTRFGAVAEVLVNAGYRKASEVAEEIFAEIEEILDRHSISYLKVGEICGEHYYDGVMQFDIAELKKKYIGEDKL